MANDSDVRTAPASAIRHKSLWFDDGSIVLCVEHTLFRVHRTILCKHSEIFSDMFKIPQTRSDTTIEGCTVVSLPDKAVDFVDLLKVLYDPLYFDRIGPDASVDSLLTLVSGIVRLSTKYYFQNLRQKSIDILERKIPTSSLSDMDTIFGTCVSLKGSRYSEITAPIRMRIVNLARETNVPELLPFAFYLCARLDSDLILKGTSTDVLSWVDKAICFAGRDKLLHAQRTLTYSSFVDFKGSPSCVFYPTMCSSVLPVKTRRTWERRVFVNVLALEPCTPTSFALQACAPCVKHAMLQHWDGRKQLWDMLPGIFQLGSWEDIRNTQNS